MSAFHIDCTTCKARLKVRSADAIGQILACPRCQSMVRVTAPADWIIPPPSVAATPSVDSPPAESPSVKSPPVESPAAETPAASAGRSLGQLVLGGAVIAAAIAAGAALGYRGRETASLTPASAVPVAAVSPAAPEAPPPEPVVEPQPADVPPESEEPSTTNPPPEPEEVEPAATPVEPVPLEPARPLVAPIVPTAAEEWRSAMQLKVVRLEYRDVPLARLFELVAEMAGIDLAIDRVAWAEAGISPQLRTSLVASDTTLDRAIDAVLAEQGLAISGSEGEWIVTTAALVTPCSAEFDIRGLASGGPQEAAALAGLLTKFAAPTTWEAGGGRGSVRVEPEKLTVVNSASAIAECDDFLRRLAVARRAAASDPEGARQGELRTAWSRLEAILAAPVRLSVSEPTPASEVVARLAKATGADLRIDRLSLEATGLSPDAPATLVVEDRPLGETLDQFAQSLGWEGLPGGAGEWVLTSPQLASRRMLVEFHPVGDRLSATLTGAVLLQRLSAEVAPSSWGLNGGPGTAYFDEASRTLIVRQSPRDQRLVEQWLRAVR